MAGLAAATGGKPCAMVHYGEGLRVKHWHLAGVLLYRDQEAATGRSETLEQFDSNRLFYLRLRHSSRGGG